MTLGALGLSLQSSKTRIWDASRYLEHRIANREWWLGKLGKEMSAISDYGDTSEEPSPLAESAKSVLMHCIDNSHGAWLKLGRAAFRALHPLDKSTVIPRLLTEIDRVWALASDIAMALRTPKSTNGNGALSQEVPASFMKGAHRVVGLPGSDFALIWILHALSNRRWSGRAVLNPLCELVPSTTTAWREVVLALESEDALTGIDDAGANGWHHRARAFVTGVADTGAARNLDDATSGFERALTGIIAEYARSGKGAGGIRSSTAN